MTNRKSILPRQPVGPGGPKSGGGSRPVPDVSPDDVEVEPAELVELVELPDALVVEVEPADAVPMSGIEAGPAPKLDAAGAAGLHAERHSARGMEVRRTARLNPSKCLAVRAI